MFDFYDDNYSNGNSQPGEGTEESDLQKRHDFIPWPKNGIPASNLISAYKFTIFVDASFVRNKGFDGFIRKWVENKNVTNTNRFFFIPSYEKKKLNESELKQIAFDCCREFFGKDAEDCLRQIKGRNKKWNVIWLTDDEETTAKMKLIEDVNEIQIRWYGITEDGLLCRVGQREVKPHPQKRERIEKKQLFPVATSFATIQRSVNSPSKVPAAQEMVYASSSQTRYILVDAIMSDHISITYKTDKPEYFAKIYTPHILLTDMFEKKAQLMLEKPLDIEGVCWPKDTLRDVSGSFVGILVPASRGVQLSKSILAGTSGIKQFFPTWDKYDLCEAAITIVSTICKLQEAGVYFGCINPSSIYVENSSCMNFVDMDEMQIEGFPVLSQNQTFTLPERVDLPKEPHLFNRDEENYQVALLVFMIIMPGKYPYAKRRSNSEFDSIRNMSFPFSIGEQRRSQDAEHPGGIWQIIWDHIPYNLCNKFYNTFTKNGIHALPGKRLYASSWLTMLNSFKKDLENPENADSRALIPKTFRKDGRRAFYRCSICKQEHPEFYFLKKVRVQNEKIDIWASGYRICLPCAVDQSSDPDACFVCHSCGRKFYYTNRTKVIHDIGKLDFDWKNQKWCSGCKKRTTKCRRCGKDVPIYQIREFEDRKRNQRMSVCSDCFSGLIEEEKRRKSKVYESRKCRNCGRLFDITVGEAEDFETKGLSLPSRCKNCRGHR